jgi:hypothetical protein
MNRARSLVLSAAARGVAVRACIVAAGLLLATSDAFAQNRRVPQNFTVVPIAITSVTVQDGQLFANGLIGSNPFRAPLLVSSQPSGRACPILNLQLGPIDLTLLGLRVETSQICLDVTARAGGGLLGDLLCGVANLLQGGLSLPEILGQLQAAGTLDRFLNGLTAVLNQTFDRITANTNLVGATCSVLSLAVGPLDLNVLGLEVELDDCAGGPVTVDITAIPGGGLLGDLLCGLAGGPLNNPLTPPVQRLLFQITLLLGALLA